MAAEALIGSSVRTGDAITAMDEASGAAAQAENSDGDRPAPPVFPLLNNTGAPNASGSDLQGPGRRPTDDDGDDEPAVARPFLRTSSPDSGGRSAQRGAGDDFDKVPDKLVYKMHKFSLYETASRYYIVGGDVTERRYRILKIDRTSEDLDLSMTDDKIVYSRQEMNQLLDAIDDGNKAAGGIKLRCTTWGLLGFIKFTGPYYMLLITKKSTVAMIGGHYVYQVDGTELIPLTPARYRADVRNTGESRFLAILNNLDLTRSFYYSYSYDITRTLQHNVTRERDALASGMPCSVDDDFNSMFVWNSYLLQPAAKALRDPYDWCRPIIHGYIDQAGKVVASLLVRALAADRMQHCLFTGGRHTSQSLLGALAILPERGFSSEGPTTS